MPHNEPDGGPSRRAVLGSLAAVGVAPTTAVGRAVQSDDERAGDAGTDEDGLHWRSTYGPEGRRIECFDAAAHESGYYLAGASTPADSGAGIGWIASIGREGSLRWQRTVGFGGGSIPFWSVATGADGGCVAVGEYNTTLFDGADVNLVKFSPEGDQEWRRHYATDLQAIPRVVVGIDDGYVVGATVTTTAQRGRDVWFLRVDADGQRRWLRTYSDGDAVETVHDIVALEDGFVLAGGTDAEDDGTLVRVRRVDGDGSLNWDRTYPRDSTWPLARAMTRTSDGGFLVGGLTGNPSDYFSAMALKLDADGEQAWHWSDEFESACRAVVERRDGGYLLAGGRVEDGWMAALDEQGRLLATQSVSELGVDVFRSVLPARDGYFAAGSSRPPDETPERAWAVETSPIAASDAVPIGSGSGSDGGTDLDDDGDGDPVPGPGFAGALAGIVGGYALARTRRSEENWRREAGAVAGVSKPGREE